MKLLRLPSRDTKWLQLVIEVTRNTAILLLHLALYSNCTSQEILCVTDMIIRLREHFNVDSKIMDDCIILCSSSATQVT